MPDSLALRVAPAGLAARIQGYFRFVARTMPPAFQLYKGLPGLHVAVHNPDDAEAAADGATHEVTIVETHTPDAPFIFESLKNYFQKEGLRVFSAVHPDLHRPPPMGARGLDRRVAGRWLARAVLPVPHRARRREGSAAPHRAPGVLGAEVGVPRRRGLSGDEARRVTDLGPRLRGRTAPAADADAARAFLDWLRGDNYVMLGMMRYVFGPDGEPHEDQTSPLGVFNDPALLPVVFPGLMEVEQAQLRPAAGDDRIIDIDYCPNAQAIHHLEPIDDIVIREWKPDGSIASAMLLLGRLAKGALAAKPQDVPLLKEKLAWLLANSGEASNSHAYRETRALFNHFPRRELLYADAPSIATMIDRIVYMAGDNEIVVTERHGAGYTAVAIAFSDLHYSHKAEEDLKSALGEAFGPISFNTWADLGVIALLLFYFDESTLEHPVDVDEVRDITERVISTWEDRVGVILEQSFGPLEGPPAVQTLRAIGNAQRPLPRVDAPRGSAGRPQALRDARGAARNQRAPGLVGDRDAEAVFAAAARPHRDAPHPRAPRAAGARGAGDPDRAAGRPPKSTSSA